VYAPTGVTHSLFVELTLTADDPDELAAAGYDWLTLGLVSALSEEPWTGTPQAGGGLTGGGQDPAARWEGLAVPKNSTVVVDHRNEALDQRSAGAEVLPWLLAEMRRRPDQTRLRVGTAEFIVDFEQGLDAFVKLAWEVDEPLFSRPVGPSPADGILRTLWYAGTRYRPVFGHVSYGNMGGRTELERNLPRMVGNSYLNTPRWHEFLRGYSWWTIVPRELLGRVGGVTALRASGAFHEILELPRGAVWLRASERFADYDNAAVKAVWSALRGAVIPGTPRPGTVYPGDPPNRMTVFPEGDATV
jgi:hypothetical protein